MANGFVNVSYTVLGVERIHGGALVALAFVEMDIAGVVIVLQGCQVFRNLDGGLSVRAPRFRDARGEWRSAVVLPDSLHRALGDELLADFRSSN